MLHNKNTEVTSGGEKHPKLSGDGSPGLLLGFCQHLASALRSSFSNIAAELLAGTFVNYFALRRGKNQDSMGITTRFRNNIPFLRLSHVNTELARWASMVVSYLNPYLL